jgi:hypothetical protein
VTAMAVTAPRKRRLFGLLPPKPEPIPVNGKVIRNRTLQQIIWSVALGVVVFGFFFSGWYDGGIQVHWYIHIGSFYWSLPWPKDGWDDNAWGILGPHTWLVNTTNWGLQFGYRHALRNVLLPAFAVMGALSVAGGARKPASVWYSILAPFLVLATAVVLIIGGMWLALRVGTGSLTAQQVNWLHLAESLVLSFVIGKALHYEWRPAGTRIQHFLMERLVDRHLRGEGAYLPVWVERPVLPPTARETGWQIYEEDLASGEAGRLAAEGRTRRSSLIFWVASLAVALVFGVDFIGAIGHVWVGILHHTFPYLFPNG